MSNIGPVGHLDEMLGDVASPIAKRTPTNTLGKEAFLRLLTTQLQHQNPLEPMDNQQFVAQMAEFSALEQMQNLNKSFASVALLEASSLIGKEIEAAESGTSDRVINGVVSSVRLLDGKTILMVGERDVNVNNVQKISQ